ncbi:MAG: AbrB family transcriptional regulator [Acidobacteria bacterium]|nr:AbrB family transcriptional regulator [Acidobacteriota bacterium]MBV9147882.1 AbrB family transcriptional regulator [Acidobacteriota bacterium]MBV9435812.1 AbrB family transcriptional regulator [Acidobacteriota bacterium]
MTKTIFYSTVTTRGRITIPQQIREALQIRSGDKLEYAIFPGEVRIRVLSRLISLRGILASKKGRGMSFDQIRRLAATAARARVRKR